MVEWRGETKVRAKQEAYNALVSNGANKEKKVNKVSYNMLKREAKKAVLIMKNNAYKRLHERLESKERKTKVFKLARARERRNKDLGKVRYIKDENGSVLFMKAEIKERWQMYFPKLLNDKVLEDYWSREWESSERQLDHQLCQPISKDEVKEA